MVAANSDDVPVAFLGGSGDEIESLFVDPSVYGQGVGRLLIEHFAACREGPLRVDVNEQNAGARAFYERVGFRELLRYRLYQWDGPLPDTEIDRWT